jgi:subfamily B ATP-binding cassette protein MsbA
MVPVKIVSTHLVQLSVGVGVGLIIFLYMKTAGESVSISDFMTFIIAVGMAQKPLKQLTNINVKIQRGVTGASSLFELLDEQLELNTGSIDIGRVNGNIEFRDVVFGYQEDSPVLKGISFQVNAGETVALVGRSGAGKTTISSLLPRFFDYNDGQILLDDLPITEYRLDSLRKQIAMVSQKVVLFNDSVRNNVAYGELGDASDEAVLSALKDAHAWEFVSQLPNGIHSQIGDGGVSLSGGQRQRLAIARALLKNAPVLILDEATSALDSESEFRIQQALERVMENRTTLVIAHRLSTIEGADRILVMDDGKLVEQGNHAELLAKDGYYTQLYRKNFED